MTNQEILEKAIRRAIEGGWQSPFHLVKVVENGMLLDKFDIYLANTPGEFYLIGPTSSIIFNHDFAKALWGEENFMRYDGDTLDPLKVWQWHLQQMVIAEDPIKYLGENI